MARLIHARRAKKIGGQENCLCSVARFRRCWDFSFARGVQPTPLSFHLSLSLLKGKAVEEAGVSFLYFEAADTGIRLQFLKRHDGLFESFALSAF